MPDHALWQDRSTIWGSSRQQLSNFYQISSNISLCYIWDLGSVGKLAVPPRFQQALHSLLDLASSVLWCFPLQSYHFYKQDVLLYVVHFEPPFKILINLLRRDNKHTMLSFLRAVQEPLSQEPPSHLHAWIKSNRAQPCNINPTFLLADVLAGCRFRCAITLAYVATFVPYGRAHGTFIMIIMPSTY